MVIGEDVAVEWSSAMWEEEEQGERWRGPPPHCLQPGASLPFVTDAQYLFGWQS